MCLWKSIWIGIINWDEHPLFTAFCVNSVIFVHLFLDILFHCSQTLACTELLEWLVKTRIMGSNSKSSGLVGQGWGLKSCFLKIWAYADNQTLRKNYSFCYIALFLCLSYYSLKNTYMVVYVYHICSFSIFPWRSLTFCISVYIFKSLYISM